MAKPSETDRDPSNPEQVEELLRDLLDEAPGAEASPARWNTAFCASGGKGPVCL
jgi:hypothetical protein